MKKHRGQIVETTIRSSGYSIMQLAARLNISRNTLYNRLKAPNLSYQFIVQVGELIHYNFSVDFPEIKTALSSANAEQDPYTFINLDTNELWRLERKYISLLERYNDLLKILVKMANENVLSTIKQNIYQFLTYKEDLNC